LRNIIEPLTRRQAIRHARRNLAQVTSDEEVTTASAASQFTDGRAQKRGGSEALFKRCSGPI
jgi:hypothetical protein